jgi:hypothetical protein
MKLADPLRRIRTRTKLMCVAAAEAARNGQPAAGAEHVLLSAQTELEDGFAAPALRAVGIDTAL